MANVEQGVCRFGQRETVDAQRFVFLHDQDIRKIRILGDEQRGIRVMFTEKTIEQGSLRHHLIRERHAVERVFLILCQKTDGLVSPHGIGESGAEMRGVELQREVEGHRGV